MTELTDTLRRTFEAIASRPIPHDWTESAPLLAEYRNLADVVDAGVGGAVDLQHVDRRTGGDLLAVRAGVAGSRGGAALAVERLGQHPGGGGLADPAHAGEEERVCHPAGADGVAERTRDVFLADEIVERLRPPAARRHEIRHFAPQLAGVGTSDS